jgi:hypothetical protein
MYVVDATVIGLLASALTLLEWIYEAFCSASSNSTLGESMNNITATEGRGCPNKSPLVRICHKVRHCLIGLGIFRQMGGPISDCLRYARRPKAKLDQEVPVIGVTSTQNDITPPLETPSSLLFSSLTSLWREQWLGYPCTSAPHYIPNTDRSFDWTHTCDRLLWATAEWGLYVG